MPLLITSSEAMPHHVMDSSLPMVVAARPMYAYRSVKLSRVTLYEVLQDAAWLCLEGRSILIQM